MGSVPGG